MEPVYSLLPTSRDQLTSDVKLGTGKIKFVLNAPNGGSWLMEVVFQFLTTVLLMMIMAIVLNVMLASNCKMDHALRL